MSGINALRGRVILLQEARFDYTPGQIRKFVKMWNDGEPISRIAEYFTIAIYEVALLVIHCELEEWIVPRKGGLLGSKKRKWKENRQKR